MWFISGRRSTELASATAGCLAAQTGQKRRAMKCTYRPVIRLLSYYNDIGFKPKPGVRVTYVDRRPLFFLCLFNVVLGYRKFYIGVSGI